MAATATVALAAHPKKGARYAGSVPGVGVNGFKAPVTFTVSRDAKTLSHFTYSTFGCFGAGGFRPGIDYYTQPSSLIKVGTVHVSSSGRFSVKGATSVFSISGFSTTTTTSVRGTFTRANTATGTITFTQKLSSNATCGPGVLAFTARSR